VSLETKNPASETSSLRIRVFSYILRNLFFFMLLLYSYKVKVTQSSSASLLQLLCQLFCKKRNSFFLSICYYFFDSFIFSFSRLLKDPDVSLPVICVEMLTSSNIHSCHRMHKCINVTSLYVWEVLLGSNCDWQSCVLYRRGRTAFRICL
jgi:hypothetical protein